MATPQSGTSTPCQCGNDDKDKLIRYTSGEGSSTVLGIFCNDCGKEWVKQSCIRLPAVIQLDKFLVFNGHQLYLHEKERSDLQRTSESQSTRIEFHQLREADHVEWTPSDGSDDVLQGIVDHLEEKTAIVIAYRGIGFCKVKITRIRLDAELVRVRGLGRIDYQDEDEVDMRELTVARARAWVGQRGHFNIFTRSCDSLFAQFCKVGLVCNWKAVWCLGSVVRVVHHVSRDTFWESGAARDYAEYFERERLDAAEGRVTRVGIVLVLDAACVTFNLEKAYSERQTREESPKAFVANIIGGLIENIKKFHFVFKITQNQVPGSAIGTITRKDLGTGLGIHILSILGGDTVGVPERVCGTALGRIFSEVLTATIKRDDRRVQLKDLRRGDQIVICATFFHPRCHAIVLDVDERRRAMKVVRNTHENGVVKEMIDFVPPVYRVSYNVNDRRPVELTIERALSKLGENKYSLLTYNCKDFANWCVEW